MEHVPALSRRKLLKVSAAAAAANLFCAGRAFSGEIDMNTRTIRAEGAEIATQSFGDPEHPAVLLIMGAMASMLWWPEQLCRKIAAGGRHVIRYDNRDTGLSTKYAPGKPPYGFDDMADDAIHVLDAYGIGKAHVAAMSLGGMIGQIVALKYPDRVLSFTAISTSPFGVDTSHLPRTTSAYMEHSEAGASVDWSDPRQAVDFVVKDAGMLAGTAHPFDEAAARAFVEADSERSGGYLSATNHFMLSGGDGLEGRLGQMKASLLVIHGTADPIFPVEHGAALAEAVPGGRLLRIEGGGHELHRAHWDEIAAALLDHTGK